MKLLVTGGAGFIGSSFIRHWMHNHPEDSIINLDALTYAGNLSNLAEVEHRPHYRFVKGDICDIGIVDSLVGEVDCIVHFAAETHVDRSILDSADFIRTNVEGTRVLLDSALKHGKKRFHHISTDEVFGSLSATDPKFTERTPYDPRSPYSASKAASDHLVRAYYHTHGLPITISNCSNNYGPYHFPEKIIPLFITNILEGKKVPVYGEGKNVRDWIFVDDHSRGVEAILLRGRIGETYCLGGGAQEVSNIELTHKMLALMNASTESIEYVPDRKGHDFRYAIDYTKAHEELGWEPLVTLDDGLRVTIQWFVDNRAWWTQVKTGEYMQYYEKNYGQR